MGIPASKAKNAATSESSSVAGRRSTMSVETGRTCLRLRPKSRCRARSTKVAYCTYNGRSRPSSFVTRARSWSVASCPSMKTTGSPTKRNSEKAISPTVSITIRAWPSLLRTNASIDSGFLARMLPMVFAEKLKAWHKRHGRRGLPWQGTRDPYRVWLSVVMLQQTQVSAVIPYYERFLRRFPTVEDLAAASEDDVLQLWSGLGYYARGRNLHAAAKTVVSMGFFPKKAEDIEALPGVGQSTAAAIAAFAFGERAAILDGNVMRVLARYFGIEGWPGEKAVETALWERANRLLPKSDIETYTQALMDLGATRSE